MLPDVEKSLTTALPEYKSLWPHILKSAMTVEYRVCSASLPGLPHSFGSSVCVDNNARMRKSGEERGRSGIVHHVSDVRWTYM